MADEAKTDSTEGPTPGLAIAIPSAGNVPVGFALDLAAMMLHTFRSLPGVPIHLLNCDGTLIESARNDLATEAARRDCAWILWIDSDMRFPRDAYMRLLLHRAPIVAASYSTRREPLKPVAFPSEERFPEPLYTEEDSTGLVPVDAVGMGLMLTGIQVFQRMPKPFFLTGYDTGSDSYEGEDVYFCRKARNLGLEILIDHDLSKEIGHVGSYEYRHEDVRHPAQRAAVAADVEAAHGAQTREAIMRGPQLMP